MNTNEGIERFSDVHTKPCGRMEAFASLLSST